MATSLPRKARVTTAVPALACSHTLARLAWAARSRVARYGCGQLNRGPLEVEAAPQPGAAGGCLVSVLRRAGAGCSPGGPPVESRFSAGSRCFLKGGGLQPADKIAGLGQVLRGGLLDGPEPVPGRGGVPVLQRFFRRTGHQHDAGQPLGEGVVDFPGQPGPLGQRPGVVLAAGKLGAGAAQLLGRAPLVFGFQDRAPGTPARSPRRRPPRTPVPAPWAAAGRPRPLRCCGTTAPRSPARCSARSPAAPAAAAARAAAGRRAGTPATRSRRWPRSTAARAGRRPPATAANTAADRTGTDPWSGVSPGRCPAGKPRPEPVRVPGRASPRPEARAGQPHNGDEQQDGEADVKAHPQDTQDHGSIRRASRGGPCRCAVSLVLHAFSVVPGRAGFARNPRRPATINLLVDPRVNHFAQKAQPRGR